MSAQPYLVAGHWRPSQDTRVIRSPFDGRPVGEHCVPSAQDIEDALAAAAAAHAGDPPPRHLRAAWLAGAATLVDQRADELADLLVAEGGKPLKAARLEVTRVASTLRWSAEEAKRLDGELLPLDTAPAYGQRAGLVTRVPVGPVLGITPFNFPLNLVVHKIGPALAAGCPIVIKPASATPLSALALGDILMEAGVEDKYLSVLPVSGSVIEGIVDDRRIAKLSFTGSPAIGWRLKTLAPRARVTLELGGNAAVVIRTGSDLETAAERIAWGGFYQAGQSCIAVQRIFLEDEIFDRGLDLIASAAEALVVGDPADERTDVGPLIDLEALDRVSSWVDEAVGRGARVVCGGKREDPLYVPTVLTDVDADMKVSCEEVFGPVVTVSRFSDYDDALRRVNDGRYGLQAAVFTPNLEDVFKAVRRLEVGGIIINDVPSFRADEMPYGGVKDSGWGREGVRYAIGEMTEPRLVVLNGLQL